MPVIAINVLRASTQVVTTYAPAQPFLSATLIDNECLIRIEDFDRVDHSAREATWPKNHRPDGIAHRTHSGIESSVPQQGTAPQTTLFVTVALTSPLINDATDSIAREKRTNETIPQSPRKRKPASDPKIPVALVVSVTDVTSPYVNFVATNVVSGSLAMP